MLAQKRNLIVCIAAASFATASPAVAETMVIGTWLPPSHPHNAIVLPTWGQWINEATGGKIDIKIEYHQGHPKGVFDGVEDGTYDAGWSFHGYYPGRFVLTKLAEMPLLGAGTAEASRAYWEIHQKYLAADNEHDGLVLAALFTHGPGQIMMREPISGLSDMQGKKVRVGGGVQGEIAKALGVTVVPAPGSKVYEILSQGVADGVFMPVGEQKTLKLAEVAKFLYLQPEGMYLGSFGIFISPDFFDSLTNADREAIMQASGARLSGFAGKVWGDNDTAGLNAANSSGNQIVYASDADQNKFKRIADGIVSGWHKEAQSAGRKADTKAALDEFRALARGG